MSSSLVLDSIKWTDALCSVLKVWAIIICLNSLEYVCTHPSRCGDLSTVTKNRISKLYNCQTRINLWAWRNLLGFFPPFWRLVTQILDVFSWKEQYIFLCSRGFFFKCQDIYPSYGSTLQFQDISQAMTAKKCFQNSSNNPFFVVFNMAEYIFL